MTFIGLIIKNLVRQRTRTGLTVLGISLGITTVVALGVVTNSLKITASEITRLGGADFMVAQKGAADLSFSTVSMKDAESLKTYPGVQRAEGILLHISRVGSNPYFFLLGRTAEGLAANPPPVRAGSLWGPDAVDQLILGSKAAEDLDLSVGAKLTIDRHEFTVVGIYQTGKVYEDAGAYGPLAVVQEIASKADVVTGVFITVRHDADPKTVARAIEEGYPNLATIASADDYGKVDQGIRLLDAANLAISVLAVGIGAIGVMNTMIMSVFERTREIGIFRAVGWSGWRIIRMILGESLVLCFIAAGVGAALGVLATRAILLINTISNLLVPQYSLDVFLRAIVVAVLVALVGAVYPAARAVRLTPMEALRYE